MMENSYDGQLQPQSLAWDYTAPSQTLSSRINLVLVLVVVCWKPLAATLCAVAEEDVRIMRG